MNEKLAKVSDAGLITGAILGIVFNPAFGFSGRSMVFDAGFGSCWDRVSPRFESDAARGKIILNGWE
jgi:hypothetical protein